MLEVNTLEFGFDSPLVTGLSFVVKRGQIKLLHGPSGCGKSTLLALISGTPIFNLKWAGEIRLNGIDIGVLPAHRRSVGIMYQDALLFPHLTVLALGVGPGGQVVDVYSFFVVGVSHVLSSAVLGLGGLYHSILGSERLEDTRAGAVFGYQWQPDL